MSSNIEEYFSGRSQAVIVGVETSDLLPVLSRFTQGSVLSPLLFLIYVNDLPIVVYSAHVILFADDLFYHVITSALDYVILKEMIHCTERWLSDNYLTLNSSKCMIVSHKRPPSQPDNSLKVLRSELEQVECYNYLGVLLNSDLSWYFHVCSICHKAHCVLGFLYRRIYGLSSQHSLKQLYLSLVRPHIAMEYACQVWDPHKLKEKKCSNFQVGQ